MTRNCLILAATTAMGLAACTADAPDDTAPAADSDAAATDSGAPDAAAGAASDPIGAAMSAGPETLTAAATIVDAEGKVLKEGSNGWTCHSGSKAMGPMCNDAAWEKMIGAMMAGEAADPAFGISYMLAGEGESAGASNIDPAATAPTADNQWVKEGPHLMITLPEASLYESVSTNPEDPVYVMWKGTPYAHLMVRISELEE